MIVNSAWKNLFVSNFLGVFNDNFLKNTIIFIAIGWSLPSWLTQSQLISVVSAMLVIPYLLLSPLGGRLSVRYSKLRVFRFFKLIEIPIMMLASLAFYLEWTWLAVVSVLLMGIQSCLYSPAKYGLIRDIGGKEGSAFGSGMFETMAFLGILLGTLSAAVVSDYYHPALLSAGFLILALGGYIATRSIRATELPTEEDTSMGIHLSPWQFMIDSFRVAREHRHINIGVFSVAAFWLIGALLQMNIIIHSGHVFDASNTATGMVMAFAAIGIAAGSGLSGMLLKRGRRSTLIFGGLIGMIVSMLVMLLLPLSFEGFAIFVLLAAFSGGVFQVPHLTSIQRADLGRKLGQIIAYMNLTTFVLLLLGTALFSLTTSLSNESSAAVFLLIIGICLLLGVILVVEKVKSNKHK